jgi:phage baseplate assembly protein V
MMKHQFNMMKQIAEAAMGARATVRHGLVSSYDPGNYCAKVRIQPEDTETGWLPVVSPWVGNGWGLFAPPLIGDLVEVQFQEDNFEAGFVCQRFFNDSDRPLSVPSGEFWLVHKSGSFLKFHNDGTVELNAAGTLTSTAPQWNHTGPVHITGDMTVTGNETVTQNITAGQDIYDRNGTKGTIQHVRDNYDVHTHGGVQTGGGNTSTPSNSL